jgi:hypothetical protein
LAGFGVTTEESYERSNTNFLDLLDQSLAWKDKAGFFWLFPRLFIFQRYRQQRFQIIAFFPASVTFLADPAVFRRDDVCTPEKTACIAFARLSVRPEAFGFRMLHVAIEEVFECFNNRSLAEFRRRERCCKSVIVPILLVTDVYAAQVLPLRLI